MLKRWIVLIIVVLAVTQILEDKNYIKIKREKFSSKLLDSEKKYLKWKLDKEQREIASHQERVVKKEEAKIEVVDKRKDLLDLKIFSKLNAKYKLSGVVVINGEKYFQSQLSIVDEDDYQQDFGPVIQTYFDHIIFQAVNDQIKQQHAPLILDPLTEQPAIISGKILVSYENGEYQFVKRRLEQMGHIVNAHHSIISKLEIIVRENETLQTVSDLQKQLTRSKIEPVLVIGEYVTY